MPCPVFLKSLPHPCPVFLRRSRREVPGSGPSLRKLSIKKLPGGALNLPGRAFCQPPRGPKTLVGAGYGARASEAKTELPGSCPEITGQLPRKPRRPPREVPGRFGPTSRLGSTLRWLSGHFPTRPRYQQIPYPGQGRLGPEPWPGAAGRGRSGPGPGPSPQGRPRPHACPVFMVARSTFSVQRVHWLITILFFTFRQPPSRRETARSRSQQARARARATSKTEVKKSRAPDPLEI